MQPAASIAIIHVHCAYVLGIAALLAACTDKDGAVVETAPEVTQDSVTDPDSGDGSTMSTSGETLLASEVEEVASEVEVEEVASEVEVEVASEVEVEVASEVEVEEVASEVETAGCQDACALNAPMTCSAAGAPRVCMDLDGDGCREWNEPFGNCTGSKVCVVDAGGFASCRAAPCDLGMHRCEGSCVSETASSCGAGCKVCPAVSNGEATCQSGACGLTCDVGALACGGGCAACPAGGANYACDGAACIIETCPSGSVPCEGATRCCEAAWEDVDEAGKSVAIALEPDGLPVLTYVDPDDVVMTAKLTGDAWELKSVFSGSPAGRISFSINESGKAAILVANLIGGQNQLQLRTRAAGACWSCYGITTILGKESATTNESAMTLAVDGTVHAAYPEEAHLAPDGHWSDLWYQGVLPATKFKVASGFPDHAAGHQPAIAVAPDGTLHVSYLDDTAGTLRHAWRDVAALWHDELVDDDGDVGGFSAIALDAAGNPHITYFESGVPGAVRYAAWDGASWHVETITGVGMYSDVAVDALGRVHVLVSGGALAYYRKTATGWHHAVLDATPGAAAWGAPSLALDGTDWLHAAYPVGAPYPVPAVRHLRVSIAP